jgi:hypothetical protein
MEIKEKDSSNNTIQHLLQHSELYFKLL